MDTQQKWTMVVRHENKGCSTSRYWMSATSKQGLLHLTIRAARGVPCRHIKKRASTIYIIFSVLLECDLNFHEEPKIDGCLLNIMVFTLVCEAPAPMTTKRREGVHVENNVYYASYVHEYAVLTFVFEVKPLFLMVTKRLWKSFQTFCNYMLQISDARKAISSNIECIH